MSVRTYPEPTAPETLKDLRPLGKVALGITTYPAPTSGVTLPIAESDVTGLVTDLAAKASASSLLPAALGPADAIRVFPVPMPDATAKSLLPALIANPGQTVVYPTIALGTPVGIPDGGTGQVAKTAAFDALQPMTTAGDIVYGGTSGTGTRLAKGAANAVLLSGTTPVWTAQDGWIADVNTWTFASATSFTIAADASGYLPKGTKVSYNDGAVDYGHVASVAFAAGTTTVTLITNSDYSIANATLTAPRYSYEAAPQGWPTFFNWAPTLAGWSANPTGNFYRYTCVGTAITLLIRQTSSGTSNNALHTATLPVNSLSTFGMQWANTCTATDNNVVQTGCIVINAGTNTVVNLNGILATQNNTNSGNSKLNAGTMTYEF